MKLYEMTREQLDNHWLEVAKKQLLFKRIVNVRYLTEEESADMGWSGRPVAFQLNDGNWIYPSCDDEGNEGGSLFTGDDSNPVLPLLR